MEEEKTDGMNPREHWEGVYQQSAVETLPWFNDSPDPDFIRALEKSGLKPEEGPALDIGAGPGTVARELARRGFQVTALDISATALEGAKARAGDLADRIDWVVDSILSCRLPGPFAFAHDRGCFHVFNDEERAGYLEQVARLIQPGGRLFLKTFSSKQPGDWGPRRYSVEEIQRLFEQDFEMDHQEETTFPGTFDPSPIANSYVLVRRGSAPGAY